jgi:hypothetical protein
MAHAGLEIHGWTKGRLGLPLFDQFNPMAIRVLNKGHQTAGWCAIRPILERCSRRQNLLQGKLEVAGVEGDVVRPVQPGRCDRPALTLNELQTGIRSRQVQDCPLNSLHAIGDVFLECAAECLIKPE